MLTLCELIMVLQHTRSIGSNMNVVPWMYLTTLTLSPCREMVVSTSPALLLQGRLWGGHQEVMALNSSCRSSFWASSSAGDTKVHSFTRICDRKMEQNENERLASWKKCRSTFFLQLGSLIGLKVYTSVDIPYVIFLQSKWFAMFRMRSHRLFNLVCLGMCEC